MKHLEPQNCDKPGAVNEPYVVLKADLQQIEQLAELGVISQVEAEAGRVAGALEVAVPANLVAEFNKKPKHSNTLSQKISGLFAYQAKVPASSSFSPLANQNRNSEVERIANFIRQTGLAAPAGLLISSGRPLSFFTSQLLLVFQPVSRFLFGDRDLAGRFSLFLETRTNLDQLLARLENQELSKKPSPGSTTEETQ